MDKAYRVNLGKMKPGQQGRIMCLHYIDAAYLHKLMALGVLPGETVMMLQTFPVYVVQIGYTQIALDRLLAESVEVEPGKLSK
jgi:ferrous iron transport protein A